MRKCSLRLSQLLAVALTAAPFINGRAQDAVTEAEPIVISATRLPIPEDESPASVSVVTDEDIEHRQVERVADALREVPGVSVVQSGAPGSLTSVFTRGLRSEHTQVLLDGIPINQGLQGAFNFADFTTDDIDRVEVVRGPQSTIYGPRALAGAIQIFTRRGEGDPTFTQTFEGGSFDTFREAFSGQGSYQQIDYSLGVSSFATDNERPNNEYRLQNGIANIGWSPNEQLRIGSLFMYQLADLGLPNTISDPRPVDNFLTERWLIGPRIDFKPNEWWDHAVVVAYDHERQVNDPNQDGFVGPTRALFERLTLDYQTNIRPAKWLTLTTGAFYEWITAGEERPFVSQAFGPQPTFLHDDTRQYSGFAQLSITPMQDLNFVAGGRYDAFNQFGDVWTYRLAGNYLVRQTGTRVHASIATGFSPPTPQDKIFGMNFALDPERGTGWDAGIEQHAWDDRVIVGATYFHNRLTNLIGFNGLFETLNLGAARTQGLELELHARPIRDLTLTATYTYLDAVNLNSEDITQLPGARLPRRPRNEGYISASYLWLGKLRTTAEAKFVNAREELNFGGPNFDIEDYSFVNLALEYELNRCATIFARVDNLTDEKYSEIFGFPALGRAAYGGLRLRF